jgi:hypothetical protein
MMDIKASSAGELIPIYLVSLCVPVFDEIWVILVPNIVMVSE